MFLSVTASLSLLIALIGIVFSLSMLFLVVWQSAKQRTNQLLAAYLLTTVVWGVGFIMFRITGEAYFPWFGVISFCFTTSGFLLFVFVIQFTDQWGSRWVRAAVASGAAYYYGVVPAALALGGLYREIMLTDVGRTFQLTPLGSFSVLLTIVLTIHTALSLFGIQTQI